MAEYITKDKAKELVCEFCTWVGTSNCEECEHPVDDVPAADVQPVRHGRWIPHMESIETTVITASRVYEKGDSVQYGFTCSECGRWEENREPFCNCGAKMDGETDAKER